MTPKELNTWLAAEIAAFPCKTALHLTDAATGQILHSFGADAVVTSASTIKTPILLATLDQVAAGRLDLSAQIPLDPSSILEDTEVFEAENLRPAYSLWEYLYWMIVESDNTATNTVLDLVGFDAVNGYIQNGLGLTATACRRKMLDFQAQAAGRDNVTTAADQCRCYELLCRRAILTPVRAKPISTTTGKPLGAEPARVEGKPPRVALPPGHPHPAPAGCGFGLSDPPAVHGQLPALYPPSPHRGPQNRRPGPCQP